jgi:hypothetical protein
VSDRKKRPEAIGKIVADWLGERGLAERVDQAAVIPEWPALVGPQIASVTSPQNELSMLEPELLRSLNAKPNRTPIRRIRWLLARPE